MHYPRVVITCSSTCLYESAYSTYYFDKTRFLSFYVLVFRFLVFSFSVLRFELNVTLKELQTFV